MKKLLFGSSLLALAAAIGCGGNVKESPTSDAPAPSAATTERPAATVVEEPVAGEADHTFNLSVPFQAVELAQGAEEEVRIGINRGENFGEQVGIEVSGLPAGVTVKETDPVIAHGAMGVTLTFQAAADAALGDFTAKVTGHTASSGPDFSKEIKITVVQE